MSSMSKTIKTIMRKYKNEISFLPLNKMNEADNFEFKTIIMHPDGDVGFIIVSDNEKIFKKSLRKIFKHIY